jgi:hypothetical protein
MSTRLIGIIILIAGLTMTPSGAEMMTKTFGETALTYYSIIGWLVAACGAAVIFLGPKRAAMPANAAQVQPPPHAQAAPQSFAPPAQGFVPPAQSFARAKLQSARPRCRRTPLPFMRESRPTGEAFLYGLWHPRRLIKECLVGLI